MGDQRAKENQRRHPLGDTSTRLMDLIHDEIITALRRPPVIVI
jgi:hypothetical protein